MARACRARITGHLFSTAGHQNKTVSALAIAWVIANKSTTSIGHARCPAPSRRWPQTAFRLCPTMARGVVLYPAPGPSCKARKRVIRAALSDCCVGLLGGLSEGLSACAAAEHRVAGTRWARRGGVKKYPGSDRACWPEPGARNCPWHPSSTQRPCPVTRTSIYRGKCSNFFAKKALWQKLL